MEKESPKIRFTLEALLQMESECFPDGSRWNRQNFSDELLRNDSLILFVYEDGSTDEPLRSPSPTEKPVGFSVMRVMLADETIDLLRIGVLPRIRRKGLARRLIESGLREAGRYMERPMFMILEVSHNNVDAIKFYLSLDFEVIHTRKKYYRDGTDALIMRKSIRHGEYL